MPSHSRTTKSYGHAHRKLRARLVPRAIDTMCPGDTVNGQPWRSPHCDRIMTDPRRMQLAHRTARVLGGTLDGAFINCLPCNLGAGATLGNTMRGRTKTRTARPTRRATRTWA